MEPISCETGRVELNETLGDSSLENYMAELTVGEHVKIDSLLHQPQTLANEGKDEDLLLEPLTFNVAAESARPSHLKSQHISREQPPAVPQIGTKPFEATPPRLDMQTLLRKRKLELEAADKTKACKPNPASQSNNDPADVNSNGTIRTRHDRLWASTGGMPSFLQLYGNIDGKKSSLKQIPKPHAGAALSAGAMREDYERIEAERLPQKSLPAPTLRPITKPMQIIVSSSLLGIINSFATFEIYFPPWSSLSVIQ